MTYANFGCYRLKGGHSAAVKNLPSSHDFNVWPYNRQALTCCRDLVEITSFGPSLYTGVKYNTFERFYSIFSFPSLSLFILAIAYSLNA